MGTSSSLDVGFVFGLTQEIQSFHDDDGKHKEMDMENSQPLLVQDENPETSKGEIDQREEEINPREDSSAGRQVIAGTALPVEVVHNGSNVHGDFDLLLLAVGKDKVILIGVVLDEIMVEGIGAIKRIEGIDRLNEIGTEGAANLTVLELLHDMEPGIEGAEEETNLGEVEIGVGEGDLRDVELKAAGVGEAELV